MTRLPNEPEEEEPKTTDPRRRLELGNAEPGEPKTDVPPKPKKRRSARSLQQNQGSPERKAQDGERRWNPFRTKHPLDSVCVKWRHYLVVLSGTRCWRLAGPSEMRAYLMAQDMFSRLRANDGPSSAGTAQRSQAG